MINLHFIKVRTLILSLVLLVMATGSIWAVNLVWFRPFNIHLFYERVVLEQALSDPEFLSQINWLDQFGLSFYKDDLTDESIASQREHVQKARKDLQILAAYNQENISSEHKLSGEILEWLLSTNIKGERFLLHSYPLNPVNGVQRELPAFMVSAHELNSAKDADRYIARLKKFDAKFEQVLTGLQLRKAKGMTPPRFLLESVLDEMRAFTAVSPEENILYTHFCVKINALPGMNPEEAGNLCRQAEQEIRCSVYPAYEKLIAFCQSVLTEASDAAGVSQLPNGEAFYAYSLARNTTANYTPDEVYSKGQNEVDRILTEMHTILDSLNYEFKNVGQQMYLLSIEESTKSTQSNGEYQLRCKIEEALCEADTAFYDLFFSRPAEDIDIRMMRGNRINSHLHSYLPATDTAPAALSVDPSARFAYFGWRAVAVAEGKPGKHYLLSEHSKPEKMPTFRKVIPFSAYTQGYALYSTQLAHEHNFFRNPFDNLGRLQMELYYTALMVTDAGIHSKGWTKSEAIKYLAKTTGIPVPAVEQDVIRIMSVPGEAAMEKAGMMKIMELRQRARVKLGNEFDIREFHEILTRNGPMPLDVLESQVEEYIISRQFDTTSIFEA
ncbi:MAG: DUF885 domain-containing protein [Bacteroidia bacterium]